MSLSSTKVKSTGRDEKILINSCTLKFPVGRVICWLSLVSLTGSVGLTVSVSSPAAIELVVSLACLIAAWRAGSLSISLSNDSLLGFQGSGSGI